MPAHHATTFASLIGLVVLILWMHRLSSAQIVTNESFLGWCSQTKRDFNCNHKPVAGFLGPPHGKARVDVANCFSFGPEHFVSQICLNEDCTNCATINMGKGKCIWFTKPAGQPPIKCIIQA